MQTINPTTKDAAWLKIEIEKRRDRFIKRISVAAWSITLLLLLLFTIMIGFEVAQTLERITVGVAPSEALITTLMPLVAVVGTVSLLIAVLSTVGVFLRLRTASLSDIQLRLATLEEILLAASPTDETSLS